MPIYEFYCKNCHTIFSFLSRRISTETTPSCPGCKKDSLSRKVSRFAVVSGGKKDDGDDPLDGMNINESAMERAMESLASEAEHMDENDPRAAAQLMRKLSDMTGLKYGENMQEALARLESGEDPDAIEKELGAAMEGDELPFEFAGNKIDMRKILPPHRDETLYEM